MDTVVAGWDGAPGGRDALALADVIAAARGSRLVIAHVHPAEAPVAIDLGQLSTTAVDQRSIAADSAAAGLREVAEAEGADLIVVGTTPRGRLDRVLAGVTRELLHGSTCAIAVAPHGLARRSFRPRVVGAAFDLSPESHQAVAEAARTAAALGATVHIVAVEPRAARHFADANAGGDFAGPAATPFARLQAALTRERGALPARLHAEGRLLKGNPSEELIEEAGRGIDILVMGSRGHGALGRVFAGSVSTAVVDAAPCPVMVVPRQAHEAGRRPEAGPPDAQTSYGTGASTR